MEEFMPEWRHVLGISGGKDSAALAIHMRDVIPQMEYFFCDTGAELRETYEYLEKMEAFLGKPIARLNSGRTFEHWMEMYRGTLPSPQMRWCTKNMKLKPLEAWIGDSPTYSYVAIRSDENREGYISTKDNIVSVFPFREAGIDLEGVQRILSDAGLGMPKYYEWRSRSGCYFCFFQRKAEWVRLAERHPDLFEQAVKIENKAGYENTAMQSRTYTWSQGETLPELLARREQILKAEEDAKNRQRSGSKRLLDVLVDDDDETPCLICHL
jgi:3'-phosphoadenosine 5'-phosphosulfate sulfotransferase (PAPS reductase)/FAD synthetase